jgi:hypothetical protein
MGMGWRIVSIVGDSNATYFHDMIAHWHGAAAVSMAINIPMQKRLQQTL